MTRSETGSRTTRGSRSLLRDLVLPRGRPAALIGQSVGGYMPREIARQHPELVAQVITFGTPMLRPRCRQPIRCPVTGMSSKADPIVTWRCYMDPDPAASNIDVRSTHLEMAIDPDVRKVAARQLHAAAQAATGG